METHPSPIPADHSAAPASLHLVRPTVGDTSWFTHDRFGLFIHWGLYSLAARHEWVQHHEQIPPDLYRERYFKRFDPDLYDPAVWADVAAAAGTKYCVATTKHHEGFCLWDTKLTDFKAPNTPAGRDLLQPMLDAFRDRGLRVGVYHSLIDWAHPDFVIDPHIGPMRNAHPRAAINRGRDQARYAAYLHGQIRELLSEYGKLDVLWLDYSYPKTDKSGKGRDDWKSDELYKLIRELQPKIVLNDRMDHPDGWDIKTPEQHQPRAWPTVEGRPVVWESCQTFSGSWGYHRDEAKWKSTEQLIRTLIDTVSKGGNLLLNVGPTGRGEFDERALERLKAVGDWMRRHGRSIYGCTQAPPEFKPPQDCRLTWNPVTRRIYVHLFAWPVQHLHLDGFAGRLEYAQLLNDASELPMKGGKPRKGAAESADTLNLTLPVQKPNVTVPVVELFLK